MSFIFKWFVPLWYREYVEQTDKEKEEREMYYAKEHHEKMMRLIVEELHQNTKNLKRDYDAFAQRISIHYRLIQRIKEKKQERSLKQRKQQTEYGRLENWLTKVEKVKKEKNLI